MGIEAQQIIETARLMARDITRKELEREEIEREHEAYKREMVGQIRTWLFLGEYDRAAKELNEWRRKKPDFFDDDARKLLCEAREKCQVERISEARKLVAEKRYESACRLLRDWRGFGDAKVWFNQEAEELLHEAERLDRKEKYDAWMRRERERSEDYENLHRARELMASRRFQEATAFLEGVELRGASSRHDAEKILEEARVLKKRQDSNWVALGVIIGGLLLMFLFLQLVSCISQISF